MKALLSVLVFGVAYLLIATEKVEKTIVAILGTLLIFLLKLVTFEQAIAAVDFNVVFLLVGMMTCVYILSLTGFFEWVAVSMAKLAGGDPYKIMVLLVSVTAFLSSVLDNVTTVIMIVPVTILIMQLLELNPVPFVIMEAIASNIGGTATLIGDPPNIIIGSQAGLSFNDFLMHLSPVVLVIFMSFLITNSFMFKNNLKVTEEAKDRVRQSLPHLAIIDKKNMVKALVVLGFIFIGFFLHGFLHLEPGIIALGGSMVMLLFCRCESEEMLMKVEWGVIFFFIGMFMLISSLEVNGVIASIGNGIIHLAGDNLFLVCILILWGSAIFSAILDNIPFVITMVPLIKQFIVYFGAASGVTDKAFLHAHVAQPLWWALALGACLGGNGTLIGASANIVAARISQKNNYTITFGKFLRSGMPFLLQSMVISTIYLWWRYFR